jgi:uncharacterized protein (TIGR02001 family)
MIAADLRERTRLLLGAILILSAAPAYAEIGASLTLASQDRFRGYSVSDGYAAATFSLSYDDAGGAYFEASVMAAGKPSEGIERYRFEENAGYALRIPNGPTIDAGIAHADYSGYRIYGQTAVFTEIYAGLITRHLSAHIHYSPNYFQRGVATFYSDVDGAVPLTPHIRLNAHYGFLIQTQGPREAAGRTARDWRVGAATDLRNLTFELAVASGAKKRSFYGGARVWGSALLASVTAAF